LFCVCLINSTKQPKLQKIILTFLKYIFMKTKFFFFAMLIGVAASAQVTNVEPVGANYANNTVSFRVWWNAGSRDAMHLSKVWVWVDYIIVNSNNTTSGNTWTRATVSAASPTASVSYDGSNRQGFWLQGNSGSYSATVTVQLNIAETKFNWCAYVSDYPPNAEKQTDGIYQLRGTPPFIITTSSGTTRVNDKNFPGTNCITAITDETGCPGIPFGAAGYPSGSQGCCSGSILVDGQCYNANFSTCSSVTITEIAAEIITGKTWANRNACKTGWRIPSAPEWRCIYRLSLPAGILPNSRWFTSTTSGYDCECTASNSTYWWYEFVTKSLVDICTINIGSCVAGSHVRVGWYYDSQSISNVKCIR
jgi:hypothetical protein